MLKRIFLLLSLVVLTTLATQAQNYKTAIGLRLSSHEATVNNSISAKHFINKVVAVEGLLSFDPVSIGVLAEVHQPLSSEEGLRWMFGLGGYVGFEDDNNLGVQGLLGLDYKFINIPLNLSVDWKPELNLISELTFQPAAVGLSVRFTLK